MSTQQQSTKQHRRLPAQAQRWLTVFLLAVCGATFAANGQQAAQAMEIVLRSRVVCTRSLVTLGDVAELREVDPQTASNLASTALVPAPPPGERRFLDRQRIEELLLIRGLDPQTHQLRGATAVEVARPAVQQTAAVQDVSSTVSSRAERVAAEAVTRYLAEATGSQAWDVSCRLATADVALVADPSARLTVRGGQAPWTGSQQFELYVKSDRGTQRLRLAAEVSARAAVVKTVRALPRGTVIQRDDVTISRDVDAGVAADPDVLKRLEDAIGCETASALAANRVLRQRDVRAPILVRRGEIVTVYVKAAGVRIRTVGKAQGQGSEGDLVEIETLDRRRSFFARVSGFQQVEVWGHGIRTSNTAMRKTR